MRRSTITTVAVVLCLSALTSTSFAGNKSNNQNNSQKKTPNLQQFVQKMADPGQMLRQPLLARMSNNFDSYKKHNTHNKQDDNANNVLPVAPSRGTHNKQDDNINNILPVEVPTGPSTPPNRPGFVWVGDHWERARATSRPMTGGPPPVANGGGGVTVTSANSGPVIRDHRHGIVTVTPVPIPPQFGGQINNPPPVVLNPATTPPRPSRGGGGRPRFEQNRAPGGVTVSVVPGSQRSNDVTGAGGSPIDKAVESVISVFQGGSITPAGSRDHRRQ
jgi:hypothetical protein